MRLFCFSILLLIHSFAAGETLYLSRHADADTRQAAADWARIMTTLTGQQHEVAPRPVLFPVNEKSIGGIRIGWMGKDPVLGSPDHSPSDSGSTAIDLSPEELEAQITASEWIYSYLQDVVGVRWFFPGPKGESLPDSIDGIPSFATWLSSQLDPARSDTLPNQPRYIARWFSNLNRIPGERQWALRNRLRQRFSFNHQHFRIIRPEHFDENPEWFAKDEKGNSKRPPYNTMRGFNDHPDLAEPGVVDVITQAGLDFFAANPRSLSWSNSANDSFEFGHYGPDYPYFDTDRWFRRYPDYSNHVFQFSNKVTEKIVAQYPGRYIGTLAYLSWENVPDFPVHPQIVPYLTSDRMQWFDRDFRAADLELVRKWRNAGPRIIGTWDYMFGEGSYVPRSPVGIIADSISSLYHEGVRAYYSQVYSLWGLETHTTWLITQMLWNPKADADALMEEAYTRLYGPAAPHMQAAFQHIEEVWMNTPTPWRWLKHWKDPTQALLWTPDDLAFVHQQLQQASQLADVQLALEAFEITRAFLEYSWLRAEADHWSSKVVAAAKDPSRRYSAADLPNIPYSVQLQAAADELHSTVARVTAANPLHRRYQTSDWAFQHDPASRVDFAEKLLSNTLNYHDGRIVSSPIGTQRAWRTFLIDSENTSAHQSNGRYILKDIRRGQIFSMFRIQPNHQYWVELDVSKPPVFPGELNLRLDWYDADFNRISSTNLDRFFYHDSRPAILGIWATPPQDDSVHYGRLFIRPYEMEPGDTVQIDQASVRAYPVAD